MKEKRSYFFDLNLANCVGRVEVQLLDTMDGSTRTMTKIKETKEENSEGEETSSDETPETTTESNGWVSDTMSAASQKIVDNPVKGGVFVAVVAHQVNDKIIAPVIDWTVEAISSVFASGAEAAVEEAVAEEAVAAATGGALNAALSVVASAYNVED